MKWLAFTYVPMREPWIVCGRRGTAARVPAIAGDVDEPTWCCAGLTEHDTVVSDLVEPWLRASSVPELQAVCAMRGIDWDSDVRIRPDVWWDPDAERPRPSGLEGRPK